MQLAPVGVQPCCLGDRVVGKGHDHVSGGYLDLPTPAAGMSFFLIRECDLLFASDRPSAFALFMIVGIHVGVCGVRADAERKPSISAVYVRALFPEILGDDLRGKLCRFPRGRFEDLKWSVPTAMRSLSSEMHTVEEIDGISQLCQRELSWRRLFGIDGYPVISFSVGRRIRRKWRQDASPFEKGHSSCRSLARLACWLCCSRNLTVRPAIPDSRGAS